MKVNIQRNISGNLFLDSKDRLGEPNWNPSFALKRELFQEILPESGAVEFELVRSYKNKSTENSFVLYSLGKDETHIAIVEKNPRDHEDQEKFKLRQDKINQIEALMKEVMALEPIFNIEPPRR